MLVMCSFSHQEYRRECLLWSDKLFLTCEWRVTHAPSNSFLPWWDNLKASQKVKTKVTISQLMWCPQPDSSISKQRIAGIVWRKEAVQNSYPSRTQYIGTSLHLVPELHVAVLLTIEKYMCEIKDSCIIIKTCVCGSLVTTAWRVLRLRMEETASRYGG
jgi:hypothetical protein